MTASSLRPLLPPGSCALREGVESKNNLMHPLKSISSQTLWSEYVVFKSGTVHAQIPCVCGQTMVCFHGDVYNSLHMLSHLNVINKMVSFHGKKTV